MSTADQQPVLKRCAACRKESPVSAMKTCMHNQMHRYVCDSKCMNDFYNPSNAAVQPAGLAVQEKEVRKVVTDAMVSMVAGVTGLVPPSGPGAIPDFVQAPIDRAVTEITKLLSTAPPAAQDVAGLVEALEYCEKWFLKHSPTAPLIGGYGDAEHPMLLTIRSAFAAHRAQQEEQS